MIILTNSPPLNLFAQHSRNVQIYFLNYIKAEFALLDTRVIRGYL